MSKNDKYSVVSVTRVQEGASFEDIENGDAYETVYIVYDGIGEIIMETTKQEIAYRYIDTIWEKYIAYLIQWAHDHREKEYYGMAPACFDEWFNYEYNEMEED